MSIENIMLEEARLAILKELVKEHDRAITSEAMRRYLVTTLLINTPREWVEEQFQYMKDMGAVRLISADTVKIARITERGEHHLSGLVSIPGIQRPSGL